MVGRARNASCSNLCDCLCGAWLATEANWITLVMCLKPLASTDDGLALCKASHAKALGCEHDQAVTETAWRAPRLNGMLGMDSLLHCANSATRLAARARQPAGWRGWLRARLRGGHGGRPRTTRR